MKPETAAGWLQRLVRARAGVAHTQAAMIEGHYQTIETAIGMCCCVTCGRLLPWKSKWKHQSKKHIIIQGGHWIPKSKGREWLMLCEENVYPQCSVCNMPDSSGSGYGNKQAFDTFIFHHLGMDRMKQLQAEVRRTLNRDQVKELSDKYRLEFHKLRRKLERYE
jgi:hypothetical protein